MEIPLLKKSVPCYTGHKGVITVTTHIRSSNLGRYLHEMDLLVSEMSDPVAKSGAQLIINLLRKNYRLYEGGDPPSVIRLSNLERALKDKEHLIAEMGDQSEREAAQLIVNLIRRKYGLMDGH